MLSRLGDGEAGAAMAALRLADDIEDRPRRAGLTDILDRDAEARAFQFSMVADELRAAIAFNFNHVDVPDRRVLSVLPSRRSLRSDAFVGVQELFFDYHLRNTSDRYDFDSVRIGIQPFSSDFRGFLFQDNQLGIRFFGDRDNNRFQYNLAAFLRLEKDSNSGLNAVLRRPREDYVLVANLYRQDLPLPGLL
jgi:hypothetical protein